MRILMIATWMLLVLVGSAVAGDAAEEESRGARCARKPLSQWCLLVGAGASIGIDTNNDVSFGVSGRVGTFVLPHLSLSLLPAYHRFSGLNRYDMGTSADGYIPLGRTVMLVPGYYAGLVWYRGLFDTWGTVHGPHVSLLFGLGRRFYVGLYGAYEWTSLADRPGTQRDISIMPTFIATF